VLGALLAGSSASAASSTIGSTQSGSTAGGDLVVGTFVGMAQGAPIGIVVVAEKPAADGQARRVTMYASNGSSLSALLSGDTPGNAAALQSADRRFGAKLTLGPLFAHGSFLLSGGSGYSFRASRPANAAGLYDVRIASTGRVVGATTTGATLTGQLGLNGRLRTAGTITVTAHAPGKDVTLKALARRLTPGAYRWIVLPGGTVLGANRRGTDFGAVGKLVPQVPGVVRVSAGSAGQPGYDDEKCGNMANQVNQLRDVELRARRAGDSATEDRAHDAKAQISRELEDHCVVIE
jgi:hypothetical protein